MFIADVVLKKKICIISCIPTAPAVVLFGPSEMLGANG